MPSFVGAKKKIIVTGGSGKAGKATIRELLSHNYDVFNIDLKNRRNNFVPFYKQHLENFQDSINTISEINKKTGGIDGIIHQAAAMGMKSEPTFRINTVSTYNIFQNHFKIMSRSSPKSRKTHAKMTNDANILPTPSQIH